MQQIQSGDNQIELFENDIEMYLKLFCEENSIEDMTKEPQSRWNSCLHYIYKHVFENGCLKQSNNIYNINNNIPSNYNSYDYDMVLKVLDIYIFDMCMKYDKEISVIGFSTLTGIDESVIYDWGNGSTKLSTTSAKIHKKLSQFREESLSNKLVTGNKNPVGVIAVLNRQYGWASPYTSDSNKQKRVLTADELPKLESSNCSKLTNKLEIVDTENDT